MMKMNLFFSIVLIKNSVVLGVALEMNNLSEAGIFLTEENLIGTSEEVI